MKPDLALSILNEHPVRLDGPQLLHRLIETSRMLGDCAIDFLESDGTRRKISYQSLHELSDTLARRIRRSLSGQSQTPNVIPVLLPQSPELYVTLLAILKAGGAFCPLNLDAPEERLNFILQDVSAFLVITTSSLQSKIPHKANLEVLCADFELRQNSSDSNPDETAICPNDVAYLLYTSGSTGVPKAVAVSHFAVTQSLLAHDRYIPNFSRFLQFAAPTFDVSIFEIFFPLFRRRTLVGCTRSEMLNDLPGVIGRMHVDAAELTPTVVSNLLRGRRSVPGLKLLLTIGEMLTRPVVEDFGGDDTKKSILWGMYGPTEAAIHCTLQPNFQTHSGVGNIGFPLDTVSAFVVAPTSEQSPASSEIKVLPRGQAGELVIGGAQIAEGYLNRPELTESAFIHHRHFGRLYRTGDKARILPDGSLECLGRIVSGQVKLRGQRVELGEVEQVVFKLDGCLNVAASVINDVLVVFCLADRAKISRKDVVEICQRWLPAFMVPGDVVLLSELPQLPSGKVDKKKLERNYVQTKEATELEIEESFNEPEDEILSIIRSVLSGNIASSTHLASAGLDSLRSIRVASVLRTSGYPVTAADVLSVADVASLRSLLESKSKIQGSEAPSQSIQNIFNSLKEAVFSSTELQDQLQHIDDVVPCTPLQEAMLVETAINHNLYCNWVEIEFTDSFSCADLKKLLNTMAAKNEILRSGFISVPHFTKSYAQIIWKNLGDAQVVETSQFSRNYSLGSSESLLRPLNIQIDASRDKPRVLFQIPHHLYDGWSFDLIMRDLSGLCHGEVLSDRPQYKEVVKYYATISESREYDVAKEYWKELLSDYHPTPLPAFTGTLSSTTVICSNSRFSAVNLPQLKSRAFELSMNPQVFFQAGLAYLLGSYLGTTDIVFGTVSSGRTIPVLGIDEIVGPCIASLPLRVSPSRHRSVGDLLQNIHNSDRAMINHGIIPLKDIKKLCGLQPGTHLFDVLFVWQETLHSHTIDRSTVKLINSADLLEFKLTLEIEPIQDEILVKATYNSSIIPEGQVNLLFSQLDELVQYFISHNSADLHNVVDCFSKPSLSIANPTPKKYCFDYGPAFPVEKWANECPERPALKFSSIVGGLMKEKESLTYRDLNCRANQLANMLRHKGFGTEELICIFMEKSIDLYVSILAVMKLGLGYLPITPETPIERIAWILNETRVTACLTKSTTSDLIPNAGSYAIFDLDRLKLSEYSDQRVDVSYRGSNLAYAVFTSGSTGTPKGVLVTQDNLMSNLRVLHQTYPTPEGSRLLQACSQAFDVSVFEIFFSWYTGICLCSATKDDLFYDFESSINQMGITHLSLTPTVASLTLPDNVPTVKFLVTAGEPLTEHVRRNWADNGLYQGYGPSETTNICTVRPRVTTVDLINNIGPPLGNTSAFVIHPKSNSLVPRGGVGELCFGGDQICRGYLNMPNLTIAKFVDHPEYGRIYRSGDLGQLLSDDSILFVGRSDDQVKIRGQRVELGEINASILDFDHVRDCVSIVIDHDRTQLPQKLVTFWVPSDSISQDFCVLPSSEQISSTISKIFKVLVARLPTYMVPAHLVPVTKIPVTHQSKVDKRRLVAAYRDLPAAYLEATTYKTTDLDNSTEWSSLEEHIATALSQVVGIPKSDIGRNSSFFSLGLDSVLAISFSRSLREFGIIDAPVSVVLRNATVALLASKVSASAASQMPIHERSRPDVQHVFSEDLRSHILSSFDKHGLSIEKILPCTPLQEAMLYTGNSSYASTYYNRMIFDVLGDVERLQECWTAALQRHEIFRTCFFPTDDSRYAFAQVVLQHRDIGWDEVTFPTENLDEQLEKYVADALGALLVSNEPPVRLAVVTVADSQLLLFCCHHALYDGVAIAHLLHEIEETYHGSKLLPPVPYEPYLEQMISLNCDEADHFWSHRLKGFEPSSFPDLTGRSTTSRKGSRTYGIYSTTLETPLDDILEGCQRMSLSLLSMTQAVWAKLLLSYLGESDICFGNVVSGRTIPVDGLERLVAPCFNTIPVRVETTPESSNLELMQRLQELNIKSLPYQLTPLRRIQSNMSRVGKRLFDTLFILQQTRTQLDSSIWVLKEDVGEMDVPLVCEILPNKSQNSLELTLHYHHSIVLDEGVKLIADTYDYTLRSCVNFPSAPAIGAMNFPTRLLSSSNPDFRCHSPNDGPFLHSNFESHAVARPNAIALDFQHEDGSRTIWSFQKLNEISNNIAHGLLQHGIKPEDVIPISMPKCPSFYASILGILKAGAAFTPVDQRLPEARKRYMLSELGSKVILCQDESHSTWSGDVRCLNVLTLDYYSNQNPVVPNLHGTSLAYCLYTSGSTGKPKAVSVEHRNPIQTIESSKSIIPWTHESRILQYAAITFDMCYYDCFLAWSFGFCLCSAEQSTMLNDLAGVINSMDISLLDLTPSVAVSLSKDEVPSVEYLYCIGEAMSPDIVHRWEGKCVNSYGPTEAAFCCTIFPVSEVVKSTVIGKPFPSTSFTVLSNPDGRNVPILGVGELHIGGSQVARGYYANDELSRSRFIERDGQRLYKSGDMVRMLANGNFEFLGRVDDQVKIRGLRVELGEINHVIQGSHENISKVITQIIRSSESTKEQLVAFLVTRVTECSAHKDEIKIEARRAAKEQLPPYMIPQFFIFIDSIPLSAAGKADKKALAEIFRSSEEITLEATTSPAKHSSDWNHIEQDIRNAFSTLSRMPLEKIQHKTTIYQLGLDSISAVQLAARLRRKGFQVSAGDIFEHPNCADLAAKLQTSSMPKHSQPQSFDFAAFERQFRNEICQSHNLKSTSIESIHPCTPLQQGMIAKFLHSEEGMYYNHLRLQVEQDLDIHKLRAAWRSALDRHEMLRTGFAHVNHRQYSFAMIHYSASAIDVPWDNEEQNGISNNEIEHWVRRSATQALKSLHKPPWRMRIVRNGEIVSLDLALFHALYDAQSLQIILRDVAAAYHSRIEPSLNPSEPALQELLNTMILDDGSDARRKFWEEKTKDAVVNHFPNMLPLRTKLTSIEVVSKSCARSQSDFEAGCRTANISMQAAGQAAWAQILSAYIGEPIVTFGVVLSGRTTEAAESAAFPCITTVPITCRTDQSKRAILDQIMSFNSTVQKYQFTPLTEIQRIAGRPDEPLFDTIFAYQKLSSCTGVEPPWKIVDERATVDYPISVEMEPLPENSIGFRITFASSVLPRKQALILLDQIETLFSEFIFCAEEKTVVTPNGSPLLYSITPAKVDKIDSEVTLLHQFVEFSALKHPQKIALEFASSLHENNFVSQCWTYSKLDAEGNKVADLLLKNGVKPGRLVAICFDKCPEASFAILGILKAGCAFVAVDPGAPSARKSFIIKDSGADLLLSMRNQSLDLECQIEVQTINLDDISEVLSAIKPTLDRIISPQDRSYCLYTSGTTGTPKGCEITHENAVQAMLSFQRLFYPHWDENSRWLQFASFHFDVSVLEQYWSWSVGIRVVSAPRDLIFEDLSASIKQLEITHIDLTPSLARILHPDDVPSLCKGVFITGGEQLKQEILDVWGPKGVIYNGYGPTEATIGVTMYPRVPENGKASNIGPQFDNVGSYILQPNTEIPVLRGAIGELCVSGKLVGKGYLNRPDLTKERFPFLERFGERVYRTGDLVRILHDNSFDFIGRADDQIKLRGQRLEIGEINSIIKQSSDTILDIATLVLKHPKQQKEQLVSFIVTLSSSGRKEEPMVLLDHTGRLTMIKECCQDRLPGYMVPTHFVLLTSMPLSTNNKADAKRLKELYDSLSTEDLQRLSCIANERSGEWSDEEQKIRTVLAKMVQVDERSITKSSSIFELGLDSISVIGFSRELRNAGLNNAQASLVMKNSSISRLAKCLASRNSPTLQDHGSIISARQAIAAMQHRHKNAAVKALGVSKGDVEAISPCTPLQEGIISRSREASKTLYFGAFHFQLSDEVEESKLRTAWETVFKSTQILRTSLLASDDGFLQVALHKIPLPWKEYSISDTVDMDNFLETCREKWWSQNRDMFQRPFELIMVRSPRGRILAVHIFHALYDGNSLPMILEKVWEEYHLENGIDYGPPFQSVLAYGPLRRVEAARSFWNTHLKGVTFRPFPRMTSNIQPVDSIITRKVGELEGYENVRRKLNVTHQAIAQGCWAAVLQKYFSGAVTQGMVVSGRSVDFNGIERIIGPLFNTIPFHIRFNNTDTWASIVKRCHDFNTSAIPFQHTALRDIMKWAKRTPSEPIFDALFVFQKGTDKTKSSVNNELWKLLDDSFQADYPIAFEVEQDDRALKLTIVAQGHISDPKNSSRLLGEFEESLHALLNNPDALISDTMGEVRDCTLSNGILSETNGYFGISSDDIIDFEWTAEACSIREEISILSSTELDKVKAHTSIFELGLDSIDAIKLSSRLKKRGIDLSVSQIMRNLTAEKMAQEMTNHSSTRVAIHPGNTLKAQQKLLENYFHQNNWDINDFESIYPVTPLQEAMVAQMISSNFTKYFNHDVLKLSRQIDIQTLWKAWDTVIENFPILRTSFIEIDDTRLEGPFCQVTYRHSGVTRDEINVGGENELIDLLEHIRKRTVNAGDRAKMLQLTLANTATDKYLVLSIAHAIYDGWSLSLLHEEVRKAYFGDPGPLRPYDKALEEILNASGHETHTFWEDLLSGAKSISFPRKQCLQTQSNEKVHREERVSRIPASAARSFSKKHGITLQTLGQTVWSFVLASYLHTLEVIFGSVLSGRDSAETADALFPTMNTVAVRVILYGTRREMVQYVQEIFAGIRQYQHFPLRKAQALTGSPRTALFDTLFIYQKRPESTGKSTEILYESIGGVSDVEYPVCVEMENIEDELIWRCACKDDVFSCDDTKELLDRLDVVLKNILDDPGAATLEIGLDGTSICGLPAFIDNCQSAPGKVDEKTNGYIVGPASSTWSPIERALREVLSTVSKVPESQISKNISMFHLGLDSISAIKVSALLRKRSVKLSVSEMLRAATIETMAQIIDERNSRTKKFEVDPHIILSEALQEVDQTKVISHAGISPDHVEKILPANSGQVYMLSTWEKTQGALFYPEFKYHMAGSESGDSLHKSWRALVTQNSILRTCFLSTGNRKVPFIQTVLREANESFHDITGNDQNSVRNYIQQHSQRQPFASLFVQKLKEGWLLILKIHHALYDGVSLPQLVHHFQDLCTNSRTSPARASAFISLLSMNMGESRVKRKAFWTSYLQGISGRNLTQPDGANHPRVEHFQPNVLPDIKDLDELGRRNGVSIQSFFFAAYARLYTALISESVAKFQNSGSDDVIIGIYLANRSHAIEGLSEAAAPTVNLVPLRVKAPLRSTLLESAIRIQSDLQVIGSVENSSVGLWEIADWTGVKVDTFVNFLKLPEGDDGSTGGIEIREVCTDLTESWSRIVEPPAEDFVELHELKENTVNDAYLNTIDIEATAKDGSLNVGVFCPMSMLSLQDAEKLVVDLRKEFMDMFNC
ncbi:acetyl-CoA synthetase-like protein [Glonium stellatum]|uniref:Acetyl-CoA synthetase-like protein n=1 Tax=Glonium stellatum TaxID=574774 RepID=A0A8E2JQU8_9PEZI|nr:acetyl-CoA synthetase-like protein [Glonium stellatum]